MDLTETHDKKNNNTFSIRKLILSIILPILAYKILDQVSKTKQRKYKHYFDSLLGYEEHTEKAEYSTDETTHSTVEQLTENVDSRSEIKIFLAKSTTAQPETTIKSTTETEPNTTTETKTTESTTFASTPTKPASKKPDVFKPKITKPNINPNKCTHILNAGHWNNWKEHGFIRTAKNGEKLKNFKNPNYPLFHKPYFKKWGGGTNEQNFSGDWQPDKDCKLHRFKTKELAECFYKGKTGISVHFRC